MPWWDCFSELIDKPNDLAENDEWTDRKYAIGVLAQVGYLLENEDGAWFGVGPDAKQHFDDLGPLKVTETNESNESTPTT